MRQHKFCPEKQQYNYNAKPFPVHDVTIKEVENHYECFDYSGLCTRCLHQNDNCITYLLDI